MWKINGFVSLPWTKNVLCNMRCHYKIRNVRENYESRKIQSKSRMWSAESKPKWHNVYWKLEMLKKYPRQYSYETDRCSQNCVQTRIQCSLLVNIDEEGFRPSSEASLRYTVLHVHLSLSKFSIWRGKANETICSSLYMLFKCGLYHHTCCNQQMVEQDWSI